MANRLPLMLIVIQAALTSAMSCSAGPPENLATDEGVRKSTSSPKFAESVVTEWPSFDTVQSYEERTVALRKASDKRPAHSRAARGKKAVKVEKQVEVDNIPILQVEQSVLKNCADAGARKATVARLFPEIPPESMVQLVQYKATPVSNFQELQVAPPAVELMVADEEPKEASPHSSFDEFGFIRPLSTVSLESRHVSADGGLPENKAMAYNSNWGTQYNWEAPTNFSFRAKRNTFPILHRPLYFEDPNLERCGASHGCLTDVASMIHFAGRIPALPYMAAVEPPRSCVRAKPDCPTCQRFGPDAYFPHPNEIDVSAAAFQAAVTVGVLFLIP